MLDSVVETGGLLQHFLKKSYRAANEKKYSKNVTKFAVAICECVEIALDRKIAVRKLALAH